MSRQLHEKGKEDLGVWILVFWFVQISLVSSQKLSVIGFATGSLCMWNQQLLAQNQLLDKVPFCSRIQTSRNISISQRDTCMSVVFNST